ncbi:MAG: glycosyltransferase family 2 protein [Acutalibacteraceae bacterium]|nr:glycosyltransferase family 2 protein [Acutalibacteraceae bacterium]
MLISVVVPVYKVEKYLSRCVDSIIAQTFTDFELILVDDGSPDSCGDICEEYAKNDKRIHVIHQENAGLSAARNTGIDWAFANSNSQWITFIDSDDWIYPRYLEVLLNAATDLKLPVSICGYMQTEGEVCNNILSEKFNAKVCNVEDFFINHNVNAVVAWGKLYKKECFKSLRYPVGKLHEDEFTTYKILFQFDNVAVIEAEMYFYFVNSESIMNSSWSPRRLDALEAYEERVEYFKNLGNDRILKFDFDNLIRFICAQLIKLKTQVSEENRLRYEPILRKSLKKNIRKYKKICNDFPIKGNEWVYELAYPKQMQIYWILNSLKNKFIKKCE